MAEQSGALPVNFSSPREECSVAPPFWGSIPELTGRMPAEETDRFYTLERELMAESIDEAMPIDIRTHFPAQSH